MKVVLHLGAHKTGSTFIQNTMKENLNLLSGQGVAYFGGEDARINFTRDIVYPAAGLRASELSYDELLINCRRLLHEKAEKHRALFISNENILGYCDLIKSGGYIYPRSSSVLVFLREVLVEWDVKVHFFIRNYADFIESTYIQKIKEGLHYEFEEYRRVCTIEKISWVTAIEDIWSCFGEENVRIVKYEDFKCDQEKYLDYALGALGCSGVKLNFTKERDVNPSYSAVALDLAKHANKILKQNDLKDYRGFLTKRFPSNVYGKPPLLSDSEKKEFSKKYMHDCMILKN